jgi:hypothetical protein
MNYQYKLLTTDEFKAWVKDLFKERAPADKPLRKAFKYSKKPVKHTNYNHKNLK